MDKILKEQLLREARLQEMCNPNIDALRLCNTKTEAIRLYKATIDWALERNYPSEDILRREFNNVEAQEEGIYIDCTFNGELLDKRQVYVFHNCKGRVKTALNYESMIIPMYYFANGCDMTVECDQIQLCRMPIRVPLYIFGENTVQAKDNANAVYKLYQHELL